MSKAEPLAVGSILFVCGENALRSPMAEGIIKQLYGGSFGADAVGVRSGALDQMAVSTKEEVGIDVSGHHPKSHTEPMDGSFDLVNSLTEEAHGHSLDLTSASATEAEH